ncbi:MAG: EAL domain-containing protein [Campylobacterales bacterium]|nr:EAL domain-containing protein [Campylobacterales bacterium]
MSIVGKATLLVMSVAIALVVVFLSVKVNDEYDNLGSKVQMQQKYAALIYKVLLKEIGSELEAKANILVGNDKIKEAFAKRDRQKLYELSKPFFEEHKDKYKLMAFIGDDNVHFLRMQDPKRFGDDLSSKRPVIAEINTYHKPIYSFEPTLYGLSFVYLAPIFKDGKYIGFFHIGVDVKTLQMKLDEYLSTKTAILFETASMEKFGQVDGIHKIGKFSLMTYNDPFFRKLPTDFNFSNFSYEAEDKVMNLSEYNITDHKGRLIAKMLFATNITDELDRTKKAVMHAILFALPMLIGILVVLKYSFGVLMKKILQNEEDLRERLYFDSVTGLPNRFSLKDDIDSSENPFVILLNIDSFKEINDLYGYSIGDYVLSELAQKIMHKLPERLKLYKLSADEFAILGNEAGKYRNDAKTEKLIASFAKEAMYYQENKILISLTAGAAFERDNILEHADMALKQAKKRRIPYVVYDKHLEVAKEYESNIKWTGKLRDAIAEDRIVPFYQPIVNLQTGKIERYEALVRMIEPSGAVIAPFFFLGISRKAKLYQAITKAVMKKSFDTFENLKYDIAINIATDDILTPSIREFIVKQLKELDGRCGVLLEIVESDGIDNYAAVADFIREVGTYGAKIAIDDFGTGYSNFEHVLRLDVDCIKIDGGLIKNITSDKNAEIIVETIVTFAKRLSVKTVAEFVHSKEVFDKVKEMGIDYAQGFYISEPKAKPIETDFVFQ